MSEEGRPKRPGGGWIRPGAVALLLALVAGVATAGPAQSGRSEPGEGVTMRMLLERTIFQVDVLTLTVRIEGDRGVRLRELTRTRSLSEETADSVARIATEADRARARLDFLRDVSLDRFLEAVRESSRAAERAGFISRETYDRIDRSLPGWYAFLRGRGLKEGDRMTYRIDGDTLVTRYRSAEGELLLDQTDVGPARGRSVLAGYFAPGSDFRQGLIRSLFRDGGRAAGEAARTGGADAEARVGRRGGCGGDERRASPLDAPDDGVGGVGGP